MKEAFWGVLIVMLGMIGIVIIQVFQNVTITNDQTYYLLKEATEASMLDSIDLAYYRTKGKIKIIDDKFVENLARRFAESANLNNDYDIKIHDIIEEPPKISLSIGAYVFSLEGDKFQIGQSISSIIEAKYEGKDIGEDPIIVPPCKEGDPGCPTPPPTPPGDCPACVKGDPNCNAPIQCIDGDLKFTGWGDATVPPAKCPTDPLKDITRPANYQICECGKWKDSSENVLSQRTSAGNVYTYTWHFFKKSEITTLDLTSHKSGKFAVCLTDVGVPDTVVLVGQSKSIAPTYTPPAAVNRGLKWNLTDTSLASIQYPNPDTVGPKGTSIASVVGIKKGVTTVTATADNGVTGSGKLTVVDMRCPSTPMTMTTSNTAQASFAFDPAVDVDTIGLTWSISDTSYATINSEGKITSKDKVTAANKPIYYEVKIPNKEGTLSCPLTITKAKTLTCTDVTLCPNSHAHASTSPAPTGRVWTIANKNIATIYSTGQIDSKDTPAEITYSVTAPGYEKATCTVTINDCSSSGNNWCTVGTMKASLSRGSLPTLCPQDFTVKSAEYYDALSLSASPSFCGKDGNFTSCTKGKYVPGSAVYFSGYSLYTPGYGDDPGKIIDVNIGSSSYTATYSLEYKYGGWNHKALNCPYCQDRNQYTIAKTLTGSINRTKNYKGISCSAVTGGTVKPSLSIGNCPNTSGNAGSGDIVAGSTPITLYEVSTPDGAYTVGNPKWTVLSGPGSITQAGVYTPPSENAIGGSRATVTVSLNMKQGNWPISRTCTFDVIKPVSCDNAFYVKGPSPVCVGAQPSYWLEYGNNSAFTSVAYWSVSNTSVLRPTASTITTRLTLTALKQGTARLSATTQVGECSSKNTPTITVNPTTYYCPNENYPPDNYYPNLSGKYCYNPITGVRATCRSGYVNIGNKCYKTDSSSVSYKCYYGHVLYTSGKVTANSRHACGVRESSICPSGYSSYSYYCAKCPSGYYVSSSGYCFNPGNNSITGFSSTEDKICQHDYDYNNHSSCYLYKEAATATSSCRSGYSYNYDAGKCVSNTADSNRPTCASDRINVNGSCYTHIPAYQDCN